MNTVYYNGTSHEVLDTLYSAIDGRPIAVLINSRGPLWIQLDTPPNDRNLLS